MTGDLHDLSRLQESIPDRTDCRDVTDQLAPVFRWTVRRHHRASDFVTTHDDLEQIFTTPLGQLFHPHAVDDQQVRLQVTIQKTLVTLHRFVVQEVSHRVKDATLRPVATINPATNKRKRQQGHALSFIRAYSTGFKAFTTLKAHYGN